MSISSLRVAQQYLSITAAGPKYSVQDPELGTVTIDDVFVDGDSAGWETMWTFRTSVGGRIGKLEARLIGWDSDPRRNRMAVRNFHLRPREDAVLEKQLERAFAKIIETQGIAIGKFLYNETDE